jgi:hypothetical protein
MDIDNDNDNELTQINTKSFLLDTKLDFIYLYLRRISSDEFKEVFNLDNIKNEENSNTYEVKPKINGLILHLLYFELIFYIYNIDGKYNFLNQFDHDFFFEFKHEKMCFFEILPKKEIIIIDEQGKEIEKPEHIKNKIYTIYNAKNKNQTAKFNPYDYILSKIDSIRNYNDLINYISDPKYFSLNKFFKDNKLFNSEKLSSIFNKNIQEMLTTEIINELFAQYSNFNEYICPYYGKMKKEFLNQVFNVIFYFPIPFKNIAGFTYKQFGAIFISNINRLEQDNNNDDAFCKKLNKISFFKIVHLHEIISHYSCTIIHSNNENISISTPTNTFTDYIPDELYNDLYSKYDGGDRAESIIFGNKIKYIFTSGAVFILDNNNYENNLDSFRKKFIDCNDMKGNESIDLKKESKDNELIKQFMNECKMPEKKIILSEKNISAFRTMNTLEENNDNDEDSCPKELSYFERAKHVFYYYKKKNI